MAVFRVPHGIVVHVGRGDRLDFEHPPRSLEGKGDLASDGGAAGIDAKIVIVGADVTLLTRMISSGLAVASADSLVGSM